MWGTLYIIPEIQNWFGLETVRLQQTRNQNMNFKFQDDANPQADIILIEIPFGKNSLDVVYTPKLARLRSGQISP